jgi:hypothetical protein
MIDAVIADGGMKGLIAALLPRGSVAYPLAQISQGVICEFFLYPQVCVVLVLMWRPPSSCAAQGVGYSFHFPFLIAQTITWVQSLGSGDWRDSEDAATARLPCSIDMGPAVTAPIINGSASDSAAPLL